MKPKNKFQQRVFEASKRLPKITDAQVRWAEKNCIRHIGCRTAKGVITCTECGHSWQGGGYLVDTLTECRCPHCDTPLKVETTRKQVFEERGYMTVITAHSGYQVVRTVMVKCTVRAGQSPRYFHSEVMQRWIAPGGSYCTFARLRQTMGTPYCDSWIFHSDLELRSENTNNKYYTNVYDRIPTGAIYPRIKLMPELKRTGFTDCFYGQKPSDLFRALLTDSRIETLLKAHQTALLQCFLDDRHRNPDDCWPSVRIAIRNGYEVKDATLWLDYLDFLRYLGKDLHNAHYVCPADLRAEHDRYMNKVATYRARRDRQDNPEEYRSKVVKFVIAKGRYFGLQFTDGQISVKVLNSVDEIIAEGHAMHHCVGGYHSKEDSLILSATIDGKRIETVEVSLSKMQVIQCRGVCNQNTPYHDQIVELVNRNMPLIQQRMAA